MKASISFSSSTNVVIVYIAIVSLLFKSSRWIFDFKLLKIEQVKIILVEQVGLVGMAKMVALCNNKLS